MMLKIPAVLLTLCKSVSATLECLICLFFRTLSRTTLFVGFIIFCGIFYRFFCGLAEVPPDWVDGFDPEEVELIVGRDEVPPTAPQESVSDAAAEEDNRVEVDNDPANKTQSVFSRTPRIRPSLTELRSQFDPDKYEALFPNLAGGEEDISGRGYCNREVAPVFHHDRCFQFHCFIFSIRLGAKFLVRPYFHVLCLLCVLAEIASWKVVDWSQFPPDLVSFVQQQVSFLALHRLTLIDQRREWLRFRANPSRLFISFCYRGTTAFRKAIDFCDG